ncbi:hypothetical protein J4468_03775 [Candidatus Woesearchaeota archaeon]|nr:hypothetical protein [Candidatus Woesearchaeota archaeon]
MAIDWDLERIGEKLGFLLSYVFFTTILFFILKFFSKLPASWGYFHIAGITLIITIIGLAVRRFLK